MAPDFAYLSQIVAGLHPARLPCYPHGMQRLFLRKVDHQQARDNYRVVLKDDIGEIEIGSIGIEYAAGTDAFWGWGIDTVIPMREHESGGQGKDLNDCKRRFEAAWKRYAADPAWLADFMRKKRQRG